MHYLQSGFRTALALIALLLGSTAFSGTAAASETACPGHLNFAIQRLRSKESISFCEAFAGKTLLVVNTASSCGFTPQFKGLEALYQKYRDRGLAIVGFPSNDFHQEYDDAEQTAEVCYVNYGVTFDMAEESSVRGADANGFFRLLIRRTGQEPGWNFNKYLVSPDGKAISHFASSDRPLGGDLERAIEQLL